MPDFDDLKIGTYTLNAEDADPRLIGWEGNDLTLIIREATSPVVPPGALAIVGFSFSQDDGNTSLTWISVPDAIYTVFGSSDLSTFFEIEDVTDSIPSQGDETTFEFIDPLGIDASRRYYRIERIE